MIWRMHYPGGKGKTYQHVINLMPPHRVYIESHLGGGAVLRNKRPAALSVGIDADKNVIELWQNEPSRPIELVHGRAEDVLPVYDFKGDELVYADPPYHPATRRRKRVYRVDYTEGDHERLAVILTRLPCMVVLSGYANRVYEHVLRHWHTERFRAKTHTDVREETLWFNFERPSVLHDPRFRGDNFRERLTNRRRMQRLQQRVRRMDPTERAAFTQWLYEAYPTNDMGALQ